MGGQARTFGTDRVFNHLYDQVLSEPQQFVDGHRAGQRCLLLIDRERMLDIGHMQKSRPLQTDIHKGRFHTRQYPADFAFIDIAYQSPAPLALHENFLQHAIFDHGDPGFLGCHIDQNFFSHKILRHRSQVFSRGFSTLSCKNIDAKLV